jgi:outer membrane protein OmpA-like peptidoglycan-associated protein
MKLLNQIGRLLILWVLLVIGVGLIYYVGHFLFPERPNLISAPAPSAAPPAIATVTEVRGALRPSIPPQATDSSKAVLTEGRLPRFVTTEKGQFIATDPILFNSGASILREASMPKLDKIAQLLRGKPDIGLEIVGYTDNLGIEAVNRRVSAERAAAVMDYLVSQGIDRSRLRCMGAGSLDPIDSNDTQLGRQANRRIEFRVIKPEATWQSLQRN